MASANRSAPAPDHPTLLRSISRDRWRALEPLLDAALDLEPAERGEYLLAACGRDARLRADALVLLAACEHTDGVLDRPAATVFEPLLLHGMPKLPPDSASGSQYGMNGHANDGQPPSAEHDSGRQSDGPSGRSCG